MAMCTQRIVCAHAHRIYIYIYIYIYICVCTSLPILRQMVTDERITEKGGELYLPPVSVKKMDKWDAKVGHLGAKRNESQTPKRVTEIPI